MKEANVSNIILSWSRPGVAVTVTTIVPLTGYPRPSAPTWDHVNRSAVTIAIQNSSTVLCLLYAVQFSKSLTHSHPKPIHCFASAVFKKPYPQLSQTHPLFCVCCTQCSFQKVLPIAIPNSSTVLHLLFSKSLTRSYPKLTHILFSFLGLLHAVQFSKHRSFVAAEPCDSCDTHRVHVQHACIKELAQNCRQQVGHADFLSERNYAVLVWHVRDTNNYEVYT